MNFQKSSSYLKMLSKFFDAMCFKKILSEKYFTKEGYLLENYFCNAL